MICERFIETEEPNGLLDYRFYCCKGNILFIAVDMGTADSSGWGHSMFAKRNIYDRNFQCLDAKLKRENFDKNLIQKPSGFEKMLEIAEKLSQPFRHVRVELYNVEGKILFGELIFCNGGGMQLLEPYEFNLEIGRKIELD